jgi:hypothetical protein
VAEPPPRPERVSLEQLLTDAQEPPDRPPRRRPWLRDPLWALGSALGIYAVLRVFGFVTPLVVLAAAAFAVMTVRRVLAAVPVGEPPAALRSPAWGVTDDAAGGYSPVDGVLRVVQRWEARFSWTDRDHVRYAEAVHPRLIELADERLRQRHGITLRGDPRRAKAALGDPLWTFLHAPIRRGPGPREVAAAVAEMEKI